MSRRRVDFPHPDGPMSETNAPAGISRSMPSSATVRLSPVPNVFPTPRTDTTLSLIAGCASFDHSGATAEQHALREEDERERPDSHERRHDDRGPELRRA